MIRTLFVMGKYKKVSLELYAFWCTVNLRAIYVDVSRYAFYLEFYKALFVA